MSLIAAWLARKADRLASPGGPALENETVQSLLRQRATSPSTAVSLRARGSGSGFQEMVDSGIIREAAPGTYYVYPPALTPRPAAPKQRLTWRTVLMTISFWLLVILIPIAFIQFSG
jgi:hypothetical protein